MPTLSDAQQLDSTPNLRRNRPRNRGLPGIVFAGRFIVGMAVAVSAVADVSYLAEVAPRGLRGAMVSTNELAISIGMLAAFLTGHFLRDMHGKDFNRIESTATSILCPFFPSIVGLKAPLSMLAHHTTLWYRSG